MNKKVSIIIPCYNQEKYIQEAILSALNQTYKNIEIICVNDGSSDNSNKIIKNLADKYQNIIFVDLKENKGVINARNIAIDKSSGEYILPLDGDDTIEKTYIEKAAKILDDNPQIGIVYCIAQKFGDKNGIWDLPEFNFDNFLFDNCIFNCALFRKSDFYHAGKYKENIKNGCEDWDLWLSILELNLKPYKINEVLFNYRQIKNSRNKLSNQNDDWKKTLIKNHLDLYLNNKYFIKKVFADNTNIDKNKKYKKFFNTTLIIAIIELFIIFLMLIMLII